MRILLLVSILLASSCEDIVLEKDLVPTSTRGGSATATIDTSLLGAAPGGEEWIVVPANAGGMGLDAFAVMKYEAKAWSDGNTNSTIDGGEVDADGTGVVAGSNIPVSIADNQPWRTINANDSAAECESLGANYHLISNEEWMAIAREIELQDANWTGGTVGSGCMFRGNSAETTCGYNSATDPDSGTGRNARAKHVLSNAEEIFDISGNLWEWTDWDSATVGFQIGPTSCATGGLELPAVACGALADADYNSNNGAYTSTEGAGRLGGGSGGAAVRSGAWYSLAIAGAFTLDLGVPPTFRHPAIGFRCVFRP